MSARVSVRHAREVLADAKNRVPGMSDDSPVIVAIEGSGADAVEIVDVQPCLWNAEKKDAASPDAVDLGPGYIPAVAMLVKARKP